MLPASALLAITLSTHCQVEEVRVAAQSTDLRLVGCGEGFPDNVLWHLDRADSLSGELDGKVTRTLTGKGAIVYVIDTGVKQDHDEFARAEGSAVIQGLAPLGTDRGCSDKPATIDPCFGTDGSLFVNTHGTAVASMVAGRNVGVAPDAKIVAVYGLPAGTDLDKWVVLFDGIIAHAWAPTTPPFNTAIINMSFSPSLASRNDPKFAAFEKKMREMIGGVDRNGAPDPGGKRFLFVSVAGNYVDNPGNQCNADRSSNIFPSVLGTSIDGLIAVGGVDETNNLWVDSCRGSGVDILAPATNLLVASISGRDHYRSGVRLGTNPPGNSGTSYAAPFVAGIAALLLERDPAYTPPQLEALIKATSTHVADPAETTGGGRVAGFDHGPRPPRRRAAR